MKSWPRRNVSIPTRNALVLWSLLVLLSASEMSADGDFLLSKGKAGPIHTGMEVDTLYTKVNRKLTKLVDLQYEGFFVPALEIYLDKDEKTKPSLVAVVAPGFVVSSITVYDPRFKTEKGVGVGSTLGEIRKKYKVDWIAYCEGPLCARVNEIGMTFALDFFKVSREWDKTRKQALIPDSARVTWILVVN
jgi:hypothetical protein